MGFRTLAQNNGGWAHSKSCHHENQQLTERNLSEERRRRGFHAAATVPHRHGPVLPGFDVELQRPELHPLIFSTSNRSL